MNQRFRVRWSPPWPALALAACVALAHARGAAAQSSAAYSLAPGAVMGGGGVSASATYRLLGETGTTPGLARTSGVSADLVPGFVGGVFSPLDTVSITTLDNTYRGAAIPVNTSNNSVAGILDELGAYNAANWRLGHWSPTDSAYMEPGGSGGLNLTAMAEGAGYWLITGHGTTARAIGLPAPTLPFTIALGTRAGLAGNRAAWNQVGNPFVFPVDVSKLIVTDGSLTYFLTDVGNTLTDNVVKGWTGSAYADANVINGRSSYWVRTKDGVNNVSLIVPYVASASGVAVPALAKPAGSDWMVAITARQGERSSEPLRLGATALAEGRANPLNLTRAPSPPTGSYLGAYMPRSDWGGDYVSEFKAPTDHMSWDFVTSGADAPGEMALEIAAFDLPSGTHLWLTDLANGTSREVTPGETVTLAATAGTRGLRLEATGAGVSGPGSTITADGFRGAYPNPFAGSAGLSFALARAGDLEVQIFDLAGRRVRDLSRPGAGPGEHVLVWDGRDAGGRALASGVYLARYRAGTVSGVRRLVKVE